MKTCCVTGHRPKGFPFNYEAKDSIEMALYQEALAHKIKKLMRRGYASFITGMAKGVDLDFAWHVLRFRETIFRDILDITLEAAIPYPSQSKSWQEPYIDDYEYILKYCDTRTIVSPAYRAGCEQRRNEYMVDKSDLVLAVWNGVRQGGTWNTIRYAQKVGKTIEIIYLHDIIKNPLV